MLLLFAWFLPVRLHITMETYVYMSSALQGEERRGLCGTGLLRRARVVMIYIRIYVKLYF